MRKSRPGSAWSLGRLAHRATYLSWSCSPGRQARRERWLDEWRERYRCEPSCVVCGRAWGLGDDLHHVSYVRLGAEVFSDLWPACRRCHEAIHLVWDASPAWRAMGRETASAGIALALRRLVSREARGDG